MGVGVWAVKAEVGLLGWEFNFGTREKEKSSLAHKQLAESIL